MTKQAQNVKELEFQSIPKLLWKYFLPAFAGVIINSLYNIVDRIFIGHGVGAMALSGLSAVFPIMVIMMAFGMLIGMGAGVRVSLNLGKKDFNRAEKVLGNAFVLMVVVALFIMFLGFTIKDPLLQFFGVNNQTFDYANEYLNIILFGSVFNIVGYSLNNLIRSEGSAKVAMISMLISAGLNLILDPIFIFALDMGVAGAAYATVISQLALMIWVIAHFRSKRSVIRLRMRNFPLKKDIVWYILSIGFAPFSMQLASSLVFGTFNIQLVKYGGDLAVGAMGVIMSVAMLLVMTVIAINMAAQPIIGFNYGSKNYKRVRETLIISLIFATIISILGFALSELFPRTIIKAFNNDSAELLDIGTRGLRIFLLALPLVGFQIITGNYFQSTGKAGLSALLSLLRQVIVLVPVLITLPKYIGLDGVWLAGPIADTVSAFITAVFLARELRRLNRAIDYKQKKS
ncbi:MATE family efflux transporter [Carboxylicivirga sp. M1479]|uniref:MATE family efflux transporter n=1 Tax=Carboxylicivirga sp. M1479 TaxID=2594476 RepID=UPI0011776FBC|nr:MATE family efflux transporter [Carboxylicivirga sp. M1479]TRX61167.1 MATE family efflux transporter [Carboxylicivirga sp. M1479]